MPLSSTAQRQLTEIYCTPYALDQKLSLPPSQPFYHYHIHAVARITHTPRACVPSLGSPKYLTLRVKGHSVGLGTSQGPFNFNNCFL